MAQIYLGLGSNIGDCIKNLATAIVEIQNKIKLINCSSILQTKAMYVTDQPDFYNQIVQGETHLSPRELIHFLKEIEKKLGRVPTYRYGPRHIDIDILYYDQLVFHDELLEIPHPKNKERSFILELMKEIAPEFICPLTKCLLNSESRQMLHKPVITDGLEFVEYASPNSCDLEDLFSQMGFRPIAQHRFKKITLYRQGKINFLINRESTGYASEHAAAHGPSICGLGFRVWDVNATLQRAIALGIKLVELPIVSGEIYVPAIQGIGESLIFLIDQYEIPTMYDRNFDYLDEENLYPEGVGLAVIDHLAHNVYPKRTDIWTRFYEELFNFREQKSFEIAGQKKTGMKSRSLISSCEKIRITINESVDDKSQIAEYLDKYHGEGVQHIALATNDIIDSVEQLRQRQIPFMQIPQSYYEMLQKRLPWHGQELPSLIANHILVDGEKIGDKAELLLQIFTNTLIGPIFYEIIQRFGHQGFGQGNITALFEAMELEQEQRGVL